MITVLVPTLVFVTLFYKTNCISIFYNLKTDLMIMPDGIRASDNFSFKVENSQRLQPGPPTVPCPKKKTTIRM